MTGELGVLQLVLLVVGLPVLGAAALMTIIRIARGPSMLDRVIATDVLIAVTVAGLVLEATVNRHDSTIPVILALSLVGFAGSASVAQLVAGREERRTDGGDRP